MLGEVGWGTWMKLILGFLLLVFGVVQLAAAGRIHAHFAESNAGKTRGWQNPRGWSVSLVRSFGAASIVGGCIVILEAVGS